MRMVFARRDGSEDKGKSGKVDKCAERRAGVKQGRDGEGEYGVKERQERKREDGGWVGEEMENLGSRGKGIADRWQIRPMRLC